MQRTAPAFNIRFIGRRKKFSPNASFYCITTGRNIQAVRCILKCLFGYFTGRGGRILRINRNLKGGHNRIFRLHLFRKLHQVRIVPFYTSHKNFLQGLANLEKSLTFPEYSGKEFFHFSCIFDRTRNTQPFIIIC